MLIRYQDLISLRMRSSDGSEHPIRDILANAGDLRAEYVVADIGAWLAGQEVMVGIERFDPPEVRAGVWPARVTEDELARKPEPVHAGAAAAGGSRLGPLGGVLGSRDDARGGSAAPARPDPRSGEARLRSVGDMLTGVAVEAEDGPAGKLMGLVYDPRDWRPSHLIVETGGSGLARNQRVVPAEMVRELDFDGGRLVLAATRRRVEASPDLHEADWLEGKWYNKLLAYYGLQS